MIQIFKKSIAAQLTFILIVAVMMWAGRLIQPTPMPQPPTAAPLFGLLYALLAPLPRLAAILALLLHLATGALLNNLLYERKLLHSNTLLPMLLYVVTVSLVPEGQTLTPALFSNMIILWILHLLIATDTRFKLTQDQVFGTAVLLATSTLFHFPSLAMVLPLLIILIFIYKFYNWHDIAILLLGFIAPYILWATYSFMTDNTGLLWESIKATMTDWHWNLGQVPAISLCVYGSFALLQMASLLFLLGYIGNKTVMYRNNATITVLPLIGALLLMPYCTHFSTETQLFALPFAFMVSLWLINIKNKPWIMDTLLTVWLLGCIVNCII